MNHADMTAIGDAGVQHDPPDGPAHGLTGDIGVKTQLHQRLRKWPDTKIAAELDGHIIDVEVPHTEQPVVIHLEVALEAQVDQIPSRPIADPIGQVLAILRVNPPDPLAQWSGKPLLEVRPATDETPAIMDFVVLIRLTDGQGRDKAYILILATVLRRMPSRGRR